MSEENKEVTQSIDFNEVEAQALLNLFDKSYFEHGLSYSKDCAYFITKIKTAFNKEE